MTHRSADVDRALALIALGLNPSQVARRVGIPRGTVRDWAAGKTPKRPESSPPGEPCRGCAIHQRLGPELWTAYAYLLGIYLGDGCISRHPRGVFRLRVLLDRRYPRIVIEVREAMRAIVPSGIANVYQRPHERADEVSAFWKHWPCLLPQHGAGVKHRRSITLEHWQHGIVDLHPWSLLRGLIHSDGCRFTNTIRHPRKTYRYPRYNFTNRSDDIRSLFCEYCDVVGVEWRRMNRWSISVARRDSVALMDRHIGPKR
ncbi:MAG: transcriptional regulator [Solirubrobacterales bacterium]|nr:transcriptional regulator [Solirubrobacterales bacterium]